MFDVCLGTAWACDNCIQLIANGTTDPEWSEEFTAEWLEKFSMKWPMGSVTLGMGRDEHSCLDEHGNTAADNGGECDCDKQEFSWRLCDLCDELAGTRHAVTLWETASDAAPEPCGIDECNCHLPAE